MKKCRCGSKSKSLNCGTEFLCEVKCTNTKRCGRHQCKRKVRDKRKVPPAIQFINEAGAGTCTVLASLYLFYLSFI